MAKQLKITQIKSLIGSLPKHKRTMEAIGFRRHQQTIVKRDTAQLRGMLQQVRHLIQVVEDGAAPKVAAKTAAPKAKAKPKAEAKTAAPKAKAKAAPKAKAKAAPKADDDTPKKAKGSAEDKE